MKEQAGPRTITIPEQHYRTCQYCKYYKHTMMKSGSDPIYNNSCMHPSIKQPMFSVHGNLHKNSAGVIETPEWCPVCPIDHFKNYVGQYVKRFYAPFKEQEIYQIKDYRDTVRGFPEYLYSKPDGEFWTDCEDSCIITNEMPIKDIEWVANVNDPEYKGFNPFTGETLK